MNLTPDAPREDDVSALGARIRERRKAEGLTLVTVAERTGLSATFISQVERGRCRPSVPSLNLLAEAMGTQGYVLMIPSSPAPRRVEVNRAADRPGFTQESAPTSGQSLPLVRSGNQLRAVEVVGGPHDWQGPFVHRNDEFLYVVAGSIEVELDGEPDALAAGDSLLFSGGTKLRWRATAVDSRVIIVIVDDRLTAD
ncbi:cupin domain-containing protein [soil metagenome]